MKINQLQLKTSNEIDKIKYYNAFNYLMVQPLFKSRLFEYFDFDIERAWMANEKELKEICSYYGISIPREYLSKRDKINIEECFINAFKDENVKILTFEDEKYPPLLKEIPDFPLSLYYKGNIDLLNNECNLAVVGSRNASAVAKNALNSIIKELKNTNITIVSGLAYGIDAQAHQSALENNLVTIGVIGSGLDFTYPVQNKHLYKQIIENSGVVLSEYPLGFRPAAQNFPQRNRIVVGMSKGTLVAEAQIKSGAMISANLTLDYNRELMCIPGNILNPNTQGIYQLIKNGAGIVINASDLLNQMGWDVVMENKDDITSELTDLQIKILDIIAIEEKTFDEIINDVKCDVADLMVALTKLEIKSLIKQINNKYYKN